MTAGDTSPTGPVTGLSHVQLRVADVSVSAEWYATVLGLEPFRSDARIGYVALWHRPSGVVVVLTASPAPASPTPDPSTTWPSPYPTQLRWRPGPTI